MTARTAATTRTSDATSPHPVDPFDVHLQQNPVPAYAALRSTTPVYRVPSSDIYLVTRYDLIEAILRDTETFSNRFGVTAAEQPRPALRDALGQIRADGWAACPTMSTEDPPAHDHYRAIVTPFFSPARIAEYKRQTELICADLISALPSDEPVEFLADFADPLPIRLICHVMNLDEDMLPIYKQWTRDVTVAVGAKAADGICVAAERGIVDMQHYFADRFDGAARHPGGDWFSTLNTAEVPGGDGIPRRLSIEEKLSLSQQVFVGGIETTTKLLAETFRFFAEHPTHYAALRADAGTTGRVIEEMLRLSTPAQGLYRLVTRDTRVDGVPIAAGSRVLVVYAAANRDPSMFNEPDAYDPQRANLRRHLAFGKGTHFCLGAPLTRMEAAVALPAVAAAFPVVALAPGRNAFEYQPSFVLRGLKQLWLTFSRDERSTTTSGSANAD